MDEIHCCFSRDYSSAGGLETVGDRDDGVIRADTNLLYKVPRVTRHHRGWHHRPWIV